MSHPTNAGALLPDTDPQIAEIIVSTLQANAGANLAQIAVGLVQGAPTPEVAIELLNALVELSVCRHTGQLAWVDQEGSSLLVGIRRMGGRDALTFGGNEWPLPALLFAKPKSVTLNLGRGQRKRVWVGCDDLTGVLVKQSEAVALGNVLVELHGGKVLEDRHGPEVLKQAHVEQNMTKRARMRADALNATERLTLQAQQDPALRPGHARVALAEAVPGYLKPGDRVIPESDTSKVYEVERRLNEDWVSIVAVNSGPESNVEADAWLFAVEARRKGIPAGVPDTHAGFSNEPAIAAVPRNQPVSAAQPPSADGA